MRARAVLVRISGRVQGVGFRAWVEREAARLALSGWVRNRRDGTVEALFSGPPESVEAMLEACRRGPAAAAVEQVETANAAAPAGGFEVRPTA